MDQQTRPEPMNASPHHSKVKVSLTMGNSLYVAGGNVSGKMEMECRADKGLGIGAMMVELVAIQELTSRDHSATSIFLRSRRLFQGPGLPPSNAVQAHPLLGDPPLPPNYYQARRGVTSFLFRIPLSASSPSSISFGSGIARVRYEVKASVQVAWKGENKLVTDKRDIDVVESFEEDFGRSEPEAVVVGENGKIWIQGKVVGGVIVAGESACVELQVKNHSNKKNTGLTISLGRYLHLPGSVSGSKPPLQLSDTLVTVPYKGPEYIIPPGAEGVASLVFDVPKSARGVKGGTREDDDGRTSEPLFEVRCIIGVKLNMAIGSKDINLEIPVTIAHPAALPALPEPVPYAYPSAPPDHVPMSAHSMPLQSPYVPPLGPYGYPALPTSPAIPAYVDQNHVWLPPPGSPINYGQVYNHAPPLLLPYGSTQPYHISATPAPLAVPYGIPPRPSSAGPGSASHAATSGLPITSVHNPLLPPLDTTAEHYVGPEEGKGERASRITQHLRLSSRHRSVSPQSHRYPMPPPEHVVIPETSHAPPQVLANLSPPVTDTLSLSPPDATKVVYSPRPLLSPKHSFSVDPLTKTSITKSERVEALERMAEAVTKEAKDLSTDIPKTTPPIALLNLAPDASSPDDNLKNNKTLPTLPPMSLTKPISSSLSNSRPRADKIFIPSTSQSLEPVPVPLPSDQAPPTPTLTAVLSAKRTKSKDFLSPRGPTESGLDALERRLLAEVGTRKQETSTRPDVRSILPIDIPPVKDKHEPLHDSAISSLSLADHGGDLGVDHDHDDWDDRTHRAGKSSLSGDDRDREGGKERVSGRRGRSFGKTKSDTGKQEEGEKGKKKGKDKESHKLRKVAKGRVAAWLGGLEDAAPPPLDGLPPATIPGLPPDPSPPVPSVPIEVVAEPETPVNAHVADLAQPAETVEHQSEKPEESGNPDTVSSIPNPRSSGFVPIGTFKRDPFQRYPTARGGPPINPAAEEAQNVADIWSKDSANPTLRTKPIALRSAPVGATQSIRTDTKVSPPSSSTLRDDVITNGRPPFQYRALGERDNLPFSSKMKLPPSQKLSVYPPQQDPEIKYNVRSARGGRGGKVTSVAAIWAAGAFSKKDDPKPAKPAPPPLSKKPVLPSVAERKPMSRPSPFLASKSPLLLSAAKKSGSSTASSEGSTSTVEPVVHDVGGKRVIKSASVPAMVSSSLATPVLSSTASLARPVTTAKTSFKVPPTNGVIKDLPRVSGSSSQQPPQGNPGRTVPSSSGTKNDLAFGQARLRDLIRKYQGQAT